MQDGGAVTEKKLTRLGTLGYNRNMFPRPRFDPEMLAALKAQVDPPRIKSVSHAVLIAVAEWLERRGWKRTKSKT